MSYFFFFFFQLLIYDRSDKLKKITLSLDQLHIPAILNNDRFQIKNYILLLNIKTMFSDRLIFFSFFLI